MPLLAAMLVNLFGGAFTFLVSAFGMRAAIAAAAVAAFTTLTIALYGAMGVLVASITSVFPSTAAGLLGVWLVIPDNGPICLAAILSCDAAMALYRWNVGVVKLAAA